MIVKLTGKKTGFSHPKCYANADENCSVKISKEHFISASLLRQIEFNNTAKIFGLKWQKPETFNIVPIPGLASNILCERHNHALSILDSEVGRLSETIGEFDKLTHPSLGSDISVKKHFSGRAIELWMLKCILGMSASKNIRGNLKPECVEILFGKRVWPTGWGLYFTASLNESIYHSSSFLIETLYDTKNNLVLAARFFIRGLPFSLCMGKPDNSGSFGLRRPSEIIFESPNSTQTIGLSWSPAHNGKPITLTRAGTYDGPPPNWREWEKH